MQDRIDRLKVSQLRTIIVGGNKIAIDLAEKLLQFNHDIVLIESNYQIVKKIENQVDIMVIEGEGIDNQVLKKAKINKTDLLIAITDDDKYNLLVGIYAKNFGVEHVIIKINNQNYLPKDSKHSKLIDLVINPRWRIIKRIKDILKPDLELQRLIASEFKISQLKVVHNSKFSYRQVSNLSLPKNSLLITIIKGDKAIIPNGKTKIYPGDKLFFLFKKGIRYKINSLLNPNQLEPAKAIFIGANEISYNLARLNNLKSNITIIESDFKKCKEFSHKLENALILEGDGTDIELLKEEGVEDSDLFFAVSDYDEKNLLMGQLASRLGAKFSGVIVNKLAYQNLINYFGVDEVINPSVKIIDLIMDYLLRGEISNNTLFSEQLKLETVKFKRSKSIKLKKISLSTDALVIYIIRKNKKMIPDGETMIIKGDQLKVLHSCAKIDDFFNLI